MAKKVAGDMYESVTGQLFEIGRQLRQPNGYPFDSLQLKVHLQAAIEGRFSQVSGTFHYDKRKDGWTLLENVPRRLTSAKVEGISFLKKNEIFINGEEMARRACFELDANYGQEDAEWLLEHQEEIPIELRKFYVVFPATVWQDPLVGRRVPCLHCVGGRWCLDFYWLGNDWYSDYRLVRPRK